jgi:hypothetical protein
VDASEPGSSAWRYRLPSSGGRWNWAWVSPNCGPDEENRKFRKGSNKNGSGDPSARMPYETSGKIWNRRRRAHRSSCCTLSP